MKFIRRWLVRRQFDRDYRKGIVARGLFKDWSEADKAEYINETMKIAGHMFLSTFYLIGLKEGMSCIMHNDPTGEVFEMSFKKVEKTEDT